METLSDKIQLINIERGRRYEPMLDEKDVKEFIRLLKGKMVSGIIAFKLTKMEKGKMLMCFVDVNEIDKLAGDKLT